MAMSSVWKDVETSCGDGGEPKMKPIRHCSIVPFSQRRREFASKTAETKLYNLLDPIDIN
jgi:hypothetical protein